MQLDRNTFTRRVLEAEPMMYHMAKSILVQEKDCEDAVQEAIMSAWEKLNTLREEKYFKTWLTRILINTCYKVKRNQVMQMPYEEYFADASENDKSYTGSFTTASADAVTEYSDLYDSIMKLPEKIRITIVLFYVEGYSVEEIKSILRIPAGTVKSRLAKGRKLLKGELVKVRAEYAAI